MANEIGSHKWIGKSNETLSQLSVDADGGQSGLCLGVELRSESNNTSFSLNVGSDGTRLEAGIGAACDVKIIVDRKVATEINEGKKSVADAIASGEIKIRGNVDKLVNAGDLLTYFAKALSSLSSSE